MVQDTATTELVSSNDERLQPLLDGLKAVRDGDFRRSLPEVGDPLLDEIATVFNGMVDQLSLFTTEVTRVARRWAPRASSAARLRCQGCRAPGRI